MAKGVPIVMTSIGAQGLSEPERIGFVADDPDRFAEAVVRALTDRNEAKSRAAKALNLITDQYSLDAVKRKLLHLITDDSSHQRRSTE
jgi:glycosyltransferase involved in cell wall biosynthesis